MSQTALITGAARGIGAATARALAAAGYHVFINYVRAERSAVELRDEIAAAGGSASLLRCDVGNDRDIERLPRALGQRLDVLVNNAGVSREGLILHLSEQDWSEVLEVNYLGAVRCYYACRGLLERAPDPRVINVASIAATFPGAGQSVYAVSKALLLEWTRRMAHSADVRSRFYAVSPGPVATDMTRSSAYYAQRDLTKLAPVQAATTPQDVAEIIVRMAQARGDLYVGNNWVIDGGFTLAHK